MDALAPHEAAGRLIGKSAKFAELPMRKSAIVADFTRRPAIRIAIREDHDPAPALAARGLWSPEG